MDDDRARGLKAGATDISTSRLPKASCAEVLDLYRGQVDGDILVIDDDDASADLIARSVAQVGFTARRAVDGLAGHWRWPNATRPDAIVLDLLMPDSAGSRCSIRLSAARRLRQVPLIVVSGCDLTIGPASQACRAGHQFFAEGGVHPAPDCAIAQGIRGMTEGAIACTEASS